jgi:hypothetical protein
MRFLKLTPVIVTGLVGLGTAAAWLASRSIADRTGFAGSTGVALWFLGFLLLALVIALVAAGVAMAKRKTLSATELACGLLPLPALVTALILAYLAVT